jgi:hypothetical protein
MMLANTLLVAVSLLTVTQAILLPPSVSSTDSSIVNALPVEYAAKAASQGLSLECTHCPVSIVQSNGDKIWTTGIESHLLLNFSVEQGDVDKLTVNGAQIFPPSHSIAILTALQVPHGGTKASSDVATFDAGEVQRLGYEMVIRPVAKADDSSQLQLISVHLQIIEIGDKFVDGLPSIILQLVRTEDGNLMIASLETASTSNPAQESVKLCTSTLCKWRAIISSKLAGAKSGKGCGSKTSNNGTPGNRHGHSRPRPHGHHGPHQHHKHHGLTRFLMALKSVAVHILFPVFIGIAVGMAASIVGMIFGHTLVFLWRRLYRRGRKVTCFKVQQNDAVCKEGSEETKSFLDHQGPPPVYADVVIVEEKNAL